MKKFKKLLMLVLCFTMLVPSTVSLAAETGTTATVPATADQTPDPDIAIIESNLPTAAYGQGVSLALKIKNNSSIPAYNVRIKPVLSESPSIFPFEVREVTYERTITDGEFVPGDNSTVSYDFVTRNDVPGGTVRMSFEITYEKVQNSGERTTITKDIYIQTVAKPEPEPEPEKEPEEKKPASVPRVIVSGFTTDPETVRAGDTFKLTLHIKNTSGKTAVNNLEFDLQAVVEGKDAETTSAAFLPVAGSSMIYVESIPKNGTKDISIEMNAKADLAQKPYVLNVSMKYEDTDVNQYTSEASVSIPVKQEARVETSEPEVMPNSIEVGSESNIMFSIYNTGKTKLYNVSVAFEGDSVTGGDAFVGNIESGATGNVDAMLQGQAPTMDEGLVKIIVTYEDETGEKFTLEKDMTLFVNEIFIDEGFPGEFPEEVIVEEGGANPFLIIVIIAVVVIGGGVAATIIIKRKKKKGEGMEDEIS